MFKTKYLSDKKDSLLRLILYTGPALIVSMAYMDPGNYGTDIQAGASLNYDLLWVVWLSSGMAMLLQYLSGKIGIATGLSLPEIIREKLRKKAYVISYWLAAELAAAATDLAEYLGTVIALNLLFGIPMIYAAIFGALDVIIILTLATQRRFHIIERLFAIFVSVIGFGYLYEIFITKPDPSAILYHSFVPSLGSPTAVLLAVGVIGATVMPHALFVHSWLTKNKTQNKPLEQRRKMRKLHLIENIVLLTIAGMINAAIMIMAAAAFNPNNPNVASISDAYKTLLPLFGTLAGVVFLVTLLASGIASSVTGTLAGQAIMEGLLGKKINIWLRRFITRFINVIPTTIAILLGLDPLNILVYSQVILSLMIPLPMIPLVLLSRNKTIMGEFVNRKITTAIAIVFVGIILMFNSYLLINLK
ncbi:MAG TPA: Nramp family divalent metal transporter [Nitrososphaeraceae archaeon]|jgi:manganese transport protein|nr:Nramp family divalent metal transporter [Nitrososphaeraceae archaeon]